MTIEQEEKMKKLKEIISIIFSFPKSEIFINKFQDVILTLESIADEEDLFEKWYMICLEELNNILNSYMKWMQKMKIIKNNFDEENERITNTTNLENNLFTNF